MLQFPYQDEALHGPPPPSLPAGTLQRWRPLVPVTIIGPTAKRRFFPRAVLDPGADDTIFPFACLAMIGATLLPDSGHGVRWRGQAHSLRFGSVELELTDGIQAWRWPATVGFSPAPLRYPLLGLSGCLQYFDARYGGEDRIVELETNRSFMGTKS